jgi:lactate racemase
MVVGAGHTDRTLTDAEAREIVAGAFGREPLGGRRVLCLIPDATRTAPLPLMFRLFHEEVGARAAALDYLIALGTHRPMGEEAINRLVGLTAEERAGRYASTRILNHRWDAPETFVNLGTISADEIGEVTGGLMRRAVEVRLNRLVFDYDLIVVCGPVFPHEVVGFSGGNKYFFPGIGGSDVINFSHWLGACLTSRDVIGTKQTPVRRVIDRAARMINRPKLCFAMVVKDGGLAGLYAGAPEEAYDAAADLSAVLHVRRVARPFDRVLAVMPEMYQDIWTAAKGMYKTEPAVADGGEVVIYAPHISELSYTHGRLLDRVGYHVRDYFLKQWDKFGRYPGGVLAHSTHLRGQGEYDEATGTERPRIRVTLATGISAERCRRVNLEYRDPSSINLDEWRDREDEGALLAPRAGETLYRV